MRCRPPMLKSFCPVRSYTNNQVRLPANFGRTGDLHQRGFARAGAMVSILVLLALACTSNDQFEFRQDRSGRIFRLNKRTGDIVRVDADSVQQDDVGGRSATASATRGGGSGLVIRKNWPLQSLPQIGVNMMVLTTEYYRGRLQYSLFMDPTPSGFPGAAASPFTLVFEDGKGLIVARLDLSRDDFTTALDNHARRSGINAAGFAPMTPEDYSRLTRYRLEWRL